MLKKIFSTIIFICIIVPNLFSTVHTVSPNVLRKTSETQLIGNNLEFFEDKTGELKIEDILKPGIQSSFEKNNKSVFSKPATNSTFWFKFSVINFTDENTWLEVGSTNAWYIDIFIPDSYGNYINVAQTGTMHPDSNKLYHVDMFWFPLNKAFDQRTKTYYLKVKSGFIFDLPLRIGTKEALHKTKSKTNFLVAAFIGLMIIMFLYNLVLYFSLKDRIYLYYLGYLFMMAVGMPFVNNFPFLQHIEFWFIDKAWWHENYLFWSGLAYVFMGVFCINYLELSTFAVNLKKLLLAEIIALVVLFPLINIFIPIVYLINFVQIFTLLFYFTCIYAGFISLKRKSLKANYFVIGWSALVVSVFIFAGVKNGFLPYNLFTSNILYFGTAIEVWVFSLALGKRLNALQNENLRIVKEQNDLLEVKVKERTKQLDDLNSELTVSNTVLKVSAQKLASKTQKLKKLNETKNKLFATVSHELQSPLVTMQNLIQLAENKILDQDTYSDLMDKIKGDAEHIHYTLNNVLHWAMTQMKGVTINAEQVFLLPIVEDNILLFFEMAQKKNITIVNTITSQCKVFADLNILNLVFRNLINNALKFTPQHGSITIGSEFLDDYCKIRITDTGIGMSEDTVCEIFDSESIISKKGTKGEKGTGLGLSLCKEFISRSNGKIWIESEVGKGSTFFFTLPHTKDLKHN